MPRIDVDKYGASWIGDRSATIADYKERVSELEAALRAIMEAHSPGTLASQEIYDQALIALSGQKR